jgi:5-methylcytosine-specific restriction endonuclease McrA
MTENLEETKERLIQCYVKQERSRILDEIRLLILNQAAHDTQFSEEGDVILEINTIIEELQFTDWQELLCIPDVARKISAPPIWRSFPALAEPKKCERCQSHFLSMQLKECDPNKDGHYGFYCETCLQTMFHEAYRVLSDELVYCKQCQRRRARSESWDTEKKVRSMYGEWRFTFHDWCFDCIEHHWVKCCGLCNAQYVTLRLDDKHLVCYDCRTPRIIEESRRVIANNERTAELHLSANLTLKQWLAALEYFEYKCAYCLAPHVNMEHYMPVSLGGGTTASNCIPACSTCNAQKYSRHPGDLEDIFPADNLAHIRVWLSMQGGVDE